MVGEQLLQQSLWDRLGASLQEENRISNLSPPAARYVLNWVLKAMSLQPVFEPASAE